MADPLDIAPEGDRELALARLIRAPRQAVWRCWTEPALVTRWFAPEPWTAPSATLDLRPGGEMRVAMRGPEGETHDEPGVFLEVVPGERLVFTDAYLPGWRPNPAPFFTAVITLADAAGGTRYEARARHWRAEDRDRHEAMGFYPGWGRCADQLEAVARSLA